MRHPLDQSRVIGRGVVFALALAVTGAATLTALAADDEARTLTDQDLASLSWRSVGPANMGGRLAAIALAPADAKTFFIGYATGGLWKTTNAGTTFSPVFDSEATSSIGSIAVADAPAEWSGWDQQSEDADERPDGDELTEQGRAKIVWVGTGEGNGRNSSSWGHGVYRSTDGGATFESRGLEATHDIPAIAVDPRDPDVCYVAALGHLWGPNTERGVYKTDDGGETWNAVLQIDENTGAVDVILDPVDPDTVYAAMYDRRRQKWSFRSGGPEGGIYRSTDAGRSWTKLTEGLPAQTGRIGLDVSRSAPGVVMAVIESDEGGSFGGFANRSRAGGVFRSEDGGDSWERVSDFAPRPFYFATIRIDPTDDQRVYLLGWEMYLSEDGGRTFRAGVAKVPHVDFHAMVIDPDDPDHLLIGTDGGLYVSQDQGATWNFHNQMAVGQFYNIAVDDADPYRIGGGLQDNGSWIGPSETLMDDSGDFMGRGGGITNGQWQMVWFGDGFHVAFDPTDPNIVYAEAQGGNIARTHLDTGAQYMINPSAKEGEEAFRFNWNAPFVVSPHTPTTLYLGGNKVFRLSDRGDRWQAISPDLTTRDPDIILTTGSSAETAGTVVSLAESPLVEGMIWAGSDDGLVHVTQDGGKTWKDVTPRAVDGRYIAKIEPSRRDAYTAYVAVDGHRSDRFDVILLMTDDAGRSWRSIAGDLPAGAPPKVVREDPKNPDVLYVGTERGAYVTIDRGGHWIRLNADSLPTVPVDDLKIQSRAMDLVAGTHGRSAWVLDDISAISQLTPEIVASDFHVFDPQPGVPRRRLPFGGLWGDQMFIAQNPPVGAAIQCWISAPGDEPVSVSIKNGQDVEVRSLSAPAKPGINRVLWDLQADPKQRLGTPHPMTEFVPAGEYEVTVSHGDDTATVSLTVRPAPELDGED